MKPHSAQNNQYDNTIDHKTASRIDANAPIPNARTNVFNYRLHFGINVSNSLFNALTFEVLFNPRFTFPQLPKNFKLYCKFKKDLHPAKSLKLKTHSLLIYG